MTLSASDLAFYETYAPQVAAFGVAGVFEDREDRNLYRSIEKALGNVKVALKKVTQRAEAQPWTDAEITALVTLYMVAFDGQPGEWREVWPVFSKRFPERSENSFRWAFSVVKGYDAKDERQGATGGSKALRAALLAADPVRFATAA